MTLLILAMHLAASQSEPCAGVRRDHEQFKAWAFSSLKQFEPDRNGSPSTADRNRWNAFEKLIEVRIKELNRRYENCRKD